MFKNLTDALKPLESHVYLRSYLKIIDGPIVGPKCCQKWISLAHDGAISWPIQ